MHKSLAIITALGLLSTSLPAAFATPAQAARQIVKLDDFSAAKKKAKKDEKKKSSLATDLSAAKKKEKKDEKKKK